MLGNKIYLRRKKESSGKINYTLETKIKLNAKQIGVYLTTLPSLNKLLELITGEVSENYIRNKIEKRLLVSKENECLNKSPPTDTNNNPEVHLIDIERIDTKHEPTQKEINKLWEVTK